MGRVAAASFVGIGRIAFEPVNRARLGRAEGQPILRSILKRDGKLLGAFHGYGMKFVAPLGLDLEGELAHQLLLVAAGPPHRNVAFGDHPFAEIQHADVLQHFLDGGRIHEFEAIIFRRLQRA